ncbi:hypothetical protein [Streptomyces sp. NBC_00083]|uniref:hypothetical protein n=1 Tax=Streptomyces sp. NBC_00083 TaxID=2975647 RepID=UPI002251B6A0|nr:hypothetical protein [Streptomyces sp. NBC_00083]MCX5385198.1 hypothetical protein [Streptomyces sp. NBC_00083]
MADERHEWLDGDAAERLLRGEGVEPGDERAREDAAVLAALLRSLGATEPATTELPGEAAALAAFRKARTADAADTEGLGLVKVGRVARQADAPRRRRFAPVRLGLAAALACCALGGVAVAAGTGVLPGPFAFDEQDPTPASTVSADMTPGPVDTSPSHSLPPGPSTATPGDRHGQPTAPGSTGGDPSAAATPGGPSADTGTGPGHGDGDGTEQGGPAPGAGTEGGGTQQWLANRADDCRDYRSGRLDQSKRRTLESAAHGPAAVKAFCDLLLDHKGGKGDGADKGGRPGGADGGGGSGGPGAPGKGKGDVPGKTAGGGGGGKQSSVTRPDGLLGRLSPAAPALA